MTQFEVSVQIHDGFGAVLGDLHDHASGLDVGVPVDDDDGGDTLRRLTTDSPFVKGFFQVIATPAGGTVQIVLKVSGDTWSQMMGRYRTARAWWRQAGSFYLDVTLEGETTRYVAYRPDVTPSPVAPMQLANNLRAWSLSFPVQPDPVVI